LLGRKVGMTQIFEEGRVIPVTVLEVGPCTVLQVKTGETDGYASLQVGFQETSKRPARPQQGLFRKAGVKPKKFVREVPGVEPDKVVRVPLRSEASGTVGYLDLVPGESLSERKIPRSRVFLRSVPGAPPAEAEGEQAEGEHAEGEQAEGEQAEGDAGNAAAAPAGNGLRPRLAIKDSRGQVVKEYEIPPGASIEVGPGDTVADGDLLAYVPPVEAVEAVEAGMQIGLALLKEVTKVDVTGRTKGRGFQGTIKRHRFQAGDKSHGSKNVREPGSTGMGTDPGRVLKGKRMPGHMGAVNRKARALDVVKVDLEKHLLLVKGSVPGADGCFVLVQESLKS
jgi:ribosomal protein L3